MLKVYIIGSCRTNNFKDNSLLDKISKVWGTALNYTGVKYGIYHDYKNNYKGDYTLSVATEEYFDTLELIEIPKNRYKIFEVKESENAIIETWKLIWGLEEEGSLDRNYIFDFEKYYPDGKIEIHIGIKG